jgi:hypothetical protein
VTAASLAVLATSPTSSALEVDAEGSFDLGTVGDPGCETYHVGANYQADYHDVGEFISGTRWDADLVRTTSATQASLNDVCWATNGHVVETGFWMTPRNSLGQQLTLCDADAETTSSGSVHVSGSCTDNPAYAEMRYDMGHRAWHSGTPQDETVLVFLEP